MLRSRETILMNKKINVLLVSKNLPDVNRGGIQVHVAQLARALGELGYGVHILCGGPLLEGIRLKKFNGIPVIQTPYFSPGRSGLFPISIEEFSFNFRIFFWLLRYADKYHLIHLHGRNGMIYGALNRNSSPKTIITFHGLTNQDYHWNFSRSSFLKKMDAFIHLKLSSFFEKRVFKNADAVITISQGMKNGLNRRFSPHKKSIDIISNGVDHKVKESSHQCREQSICFVGRLEPVKGVMLLPEIIKSLPRHISLWIIGTGSLEAELRQVLRPFHERIKWIGNVSPEEVLQFLSQTYLLIHPPMAEPQGRVVLEAHANETPVVASDIPGLNEYIEHGKNGFLFPPGNTEKASSYINRLFQQPDLARQLGRHGKEQVENNYTWRKIAQQTSRTYQELIV